MPHEVVTVAWEGRPVDAFVPAPLSDVGELGATAQLDAARAEGVLSATAARHDPRLEVAARLLVRAEGVASSRIEAINAPAEGGNLLLNVGPRGVDAQIPDEQITRLDWLGEWVRPHADAIMGTRLWVTPGTTTQAGEPVRYSARDETVCRHAECGGHDHSSRLCARRRRPRSRPSAERRSDGRTPRPASRLTPPPG